MTLARAEGPKILVADDDEAIQVCMEDIFRQEGWRLLYARDGEECLSILERERPELLVLDQRMPRMTGEEVLTELEQKNESIRVILISAEKDLSRFGRFRSIVRVLGKPFDLEQFVALVNEELARRI